MLLKQCPFPDPAVLYRSSSFASGGDLDFRVFSVISHVELHGYQSHWFYCWLWFLWRSNLPMDARLLE